MAKYRADRFANEIQREIAEIVRREVNDPRLELVSVVQVEAASDLSSVKIFFSNFGIAKDEDVLLALDSAKGYIRKQLSFRLKARIIPELHFVLDNSIAYGVMMTDKINKQIEKDNARMKNDPERSPEDEL